MADTKGCICKDDCRFYAGEPGKAPKRCPSRQYPEVLERARQIYQDPQSDAYELWQAFGRLLHTGGAQKSRVEHLVDFCRSLNIRSIGIASCLRYLKQAHWLRDLLEKEGWNSHVTICKFGGFKVADVAVDKDTDWTVCNPLAQALLLNELGCEVNVTMGLCMGHEMIFNRYAEGYVTNLVVKEKISEEKPLQTLNQMIEGDYEPVFHEFSKSKAKDSE